MLATLERTVVSYYYPARLLPTPQKADSGPEKAQGPSDADSGADSPSIYSVRANSPNSLRAAFA